MNNFKAIYELNGKNAMRLFSRDFYTEEAARAELTEEGVKNFAFFMEPLEPKELPGNNVLFSGEVGFDITLDLMAPFLEAGKNILLNTPGGSLYDGLQMHDAIKDLYPNTKIGILGMCASAGTVIFCGAALENRAMSMNSRFMIHNALIFTYGNHNNLRKYADFLEKESNSVIDNVYVPATGKSHEELADFMDKELFITKNEVIEWGFLPSGGSGDIDTLETEININNQNDLHMTTKEVEAKLNSMDATLKAILNKNNPKAIMLKDVNGVELNFPELKDDNEIGKGAKVNANGEPANGEYVMSDGQTIVCEKGEVLEVRNAEEDDTKTGEGEGGEGDDKDKEIEKLKEENKALKQEIEQLKAAKNEVDAKVVNLTKENEETIKQVENLNTVVNELKTAFPTLEGNGTTESGEVKNTKHTGKRPKFSYKKKN